MKKKENFTSMKNLGAKESIRKIIDENYCDDNEVSDDRGKWMNTENQNIIVELLLKSFGEKL